MDSSLIGEVDVFVHVTGASKSVAQRALQAHNGDLNAAINSFFNGGDEYAPHAPREYTNNDEWMEEDKHVPCEAQQLSPFFSPVWSGPVASAWEGNTPVLKTTDTAQPNEGQVPFPSNSALPTDLKDSLDSSYDKDSDSHMSQEPSAPAVELLNNEAGLSSIGNVPVLPVTNYFHPGSRLVEEQVTHGGSLGPVVSEVSAMMGEGHEIEEEMFRAAIEASRMDADPNPWRIQTEPGQASFQPEAVPTERLALAGSEDDELARAVSLSLKTAEHEKVLREQQNAAAFLQPDSDHFPSESNSRREVAASSDIHPSQPQFRNGTERDLLNVPSGSSLAPIFGSSHEENEEPQEQPLVRRRINRRTFRRSGQPTMAVIEGWGNAPDSLQSEEPDLISPESIIDRREEIGGSIIVSGHTSRGSFQLEEWGGISSEEHDEAVMLEAAYGLGGVPYAASGGVTSRIDVGVTLDAPEARERLSVWRPSQQFPSPSVVAERKLREQQDDEYYASLAADREKEIKALLDAESRRLIEEEAASAAKAEENRRLEREQQQLLAAEQLEMRLSAKKASLPAEPPEDDDSTVTILVRMPDGRRQGRRFRKVDTLQYLFDFLDVYGGVNPGTYRLVRQYPRRTFTDGEQGSTLQDAGLNSKQEALFLEMI